MQEIYGIKEPFEGYRIFMLSSALMHEVIELQQETAWKWWKTSKGLSMERCQDEVIDVWHFLIQLSIELKMDADTIVSRYLKKNRENIQLSTASYQLVKEGVCNRAKTRHCLPAWPDMSRAESIS